MRRPPALTLTTLALATLALRPGVAAGQTDAFIPPLIQQSMETAPLSQSIFASMIATDAGRPAAVAAAGARAPIASAERTTSFAPVGRSVVPQMALELIEDRTLARRTEAYASRALQDYEIAARQRGEPLYDVARAASFYVVTAYEAYHDAPVGEAAANAVRDQLRERLLTDDAFQRLSPRAKQEMYENFAIQGTLLANAYYPARDAHARAPLDRARRAGEEALRTMFRAPASSLELTAAGVRRR